MLKSSQIASKIKELCSQKGWSYNVRNNILTISKSFTPHNMDELIDCDMEYFGILSELPRCRAGSDWGTECGGVGAVRPAGLLGAQAEWSKLHSTWWLYPTHDELAYAILMLPWT